MKSMKNILNKDFKDYSFKAKVWKYEGPKGWYFASVPKGLSKDIRAIHQDSEEGWGRLRAEILINKTQWKTSIWFDSKRDCFLVPIKSQVRQKEGITDGSDVGILLRIKIF